MTGEDLSHVEGKITDAESHLHRDHMELDKAVRDIRETLHEDFTAFTRTAKIFAGILIAAMGGFVTYALNKHDVMSETIAHNNTQVNSHIQTVSTQQAINAVHINNMAEVVQTHYGYFRDELKELKANIPPEEFKAQVDDHEIRLRNTETVITKEHGK